MLEIISPIQKQVFQRNNKGQNSLMVSGRSTDSSMNEPVTVSIVKVSNRENVVTVPAIYSSSMLQSGIDWSVNVNLNSGYYDLTASTKKESKTVRFGVGLVFACTGHSFAEGIGSAYVTDERAIIQSNIDGAEVNPLNFAAKPEYKSISDYAITDTTKTNGFWGMLAENLVKEFDCPVLIYHCSWGGTSIKAWSIAANGGLATSYAGYNSANDGKGYPYAKLKNVVQTLVPKTGIHSVLILHGNNDSNDTRENIEQYYKDVISATRRDSNIPTLPFNIALSTWHPDTETQVTTAQLNVIRDVPNVSLGADINKILSDGRLRPTGPPEDQDLHLNTSGNKQAADLWAKALIPLCKVDNVVVTPIIVLGGTNQVITPKAVTVQVETPLFSGLVVVLVLLLLRVFGVRVPVWGLLFFGLSASGIAYLNETFPKKI